MSKFPWTVTGCSAASISNYELEEMIVKKFGSKISADSEHSQLYIYCKTITTAKKVLAFAKEHGKEGEEYQTYGAGSFKASFSMYKANY